MKGPRRSLWKHDGSNQSNPTNPQQRIRKRRNGYCFTLEALPRPEALEGIDIRCCRRSSRGGTGGREACGAMENGEGGRST